MATLFERRADRTNWRIVIPRRPLTVFSSTAHATRSTRSRATTSWSIGLPAGRATAGTGTSGSTKTWAHFLAGNPTILVLIKRQKCLAGVLDLDSGKNTIFVRIQGKHEGRHTATSPGLAAALASLPTLASPLGTSALAAFGTFSFGRTTAPTETLRRLRVRPSRREA